MSTTYGATRTTLYTTTITAPTHAASVSIFYPWPAITNAPEFITITKSAGAQDTEPVLVLTDVVGVVVSTDGRPLTTGTLVQPNPAATSTAAATVNTAQEDCGTKWKCWGIGTQVGVILGPVILALALVGILIWAFCCKSKNRRKTEKNPEIESGGWRKKMAFGWSRVRRPGSETSSSSSGSPRRSTSRVIEIPQNGGYGYVPRYAVVAEPNPREAFRRAVEIQPEATFPGSNISSHGPPVIPPIRRERDITPPDLKSPNPQRPWKYKPAHNSQYSARDSVRTQIDIPPPADKTPPIDAKHLSHISSYYRPRVRDFAVPAAVLAGAGVAATVGSKRARASSLQSRSADRKEEKRKSRSRGPEPTSRLRDYEDEELPEEARSRETRDRERERERREVRRERDARINGSSDREAEGRRGSRDSDLPAEREDRRERREREVRSASPPRTKSNKAQKKGKSMTGQAKWLALLPLALRAIFVLTEPEGGWEQYHDDKKYKEYKDKKRRAERAERDSSNSGPDGRRERPRRATRSDITINALGDGEVRYRTRRATFADLPRRGSIPRNEPSRKQEEPPRRRQSRADSRSRGNRGDVGHDGAMSSDSEGYRRPRFSDEDDEKPIVLGRRGSRKHRQSSSF